MAHMIPGFYRVNDKKIKLGDMSPRFQTLQPYEGRYLEQDSGFDTYWYLADAFVYRQPFDFIHFMYKYSVLDDDYPNYQITNNLGEPRLRLTCMLGVDGFNMELNPDGTIHEAITCHQGIGMWTAGGLGSSRALARSNINIFYHGCRFLSWWDNTKEQEYAAHFLITNPLYPISFFGCCNSISGGPTAGASYRGYGRKNQGWITHVGQNPVKYNVGYFETLRFHSEVISADQDRELICVIYQDSTNTEGKLLNNEYRIRVPSLGNVSGIYMHSHSVHPSGLYQHPDYNHYPNIW